jgi:4-azaleucine resistance transporter AzlC
MTTTKTLPLQSISLSTRASEFWAGARATIPLAVGAFPFGIIFGALAVNSGLTPWAAAGLSAFVFAGSSQFIAVGLVAGGAGLAVIILTTFVVNLRHALYSVTLSPHMKHLPQRWLLPLGALLTDESFVIVAERYNQPDASPHKHWYFAGSAAFMYLNWQFWTWVGIFVGANIPNPEAWGLDFAMSVTFIGMVVPSLRNRPIIAAVIVAGVSAVLFAGLPNKRGMSVATLAGVATGVMLERGRR